MSSDLVASIPANIGNTLQIDLYTKDAKKARSYAGHVYIDSTVSPGTKNHLFTGSSRARRAAHTLSSKINKN
jgi:hypothetical protein